MGLLKGTFQATPQAGDLTGAEHYVYSLVSPQSDISGAAGHRYQLALTAGGGYYLVGGRHYSGMIWLTDHPQARRKVTEPQEDSVQSRYTTDSLGSLDEG